MEIGWRVLAGRRGEDRRRPEIRHTDPDPIPPGGAVLDPPNDQIQLIIAERLHQPGFATRYPFDAGVDRLGEFSNQLGLDAAPLAADQPRPGPALNDPNQYGAVGGTPRRALRIGWQIAAGQQNQRQTDERPPRLPPTFHRQLPNPVLCRTPAASGRLRF